MNNYKRVLVLAPHADDGELGCGGTMSKMIAEGKEIIYIAFAYPKGVAGKVINNEFENAMKVFGIKNFQVLDFETRFFPETRQMILDKMIDLGKLYNPDLVFLPSSYDTHQDHHTIHNEGFRAFKNCSILGYEQPWNNATFKTDVFSILRHPDLENKMKALDCYGSQTDRFFFDNKFIYSLAKTRGVQIGEEYAEAFEMIRWII